jgi:xanthine/uracil permease
MGIFSKFAAALVSIPSSVLGGMTTFLFASVAVSGLRIISTVPFTRRTRFILTAALALGIGAILVPNWFSFVFTYTGGNKAKQGFFDAIVLVLETGFAVTAFIAVILNLILPEEDEGEEVASLAGDIMAERAEAEREESDGVDFEKKMVQGGTMQSSGVGTVDANLNGHGRVQVNENL